jgi:hypothetical protein
MLLRLFSLVDRGSKWLVLLPLSLFAQGRVIPLTTDSLRVFPEY